MSKDSGLPPPSPGSSADRTYQSIVLVVLGFLVSYYKTNAKFRSFIATLINDAESLSKTGSEKKDWLAYYIRRSPVGLIGWREIFTLII